MTQHLNQHLNPNITKKSGTFITYKKTLAMLGMIISTMLPLYAHAGGAGGCEPMLTLANQDDMACQNLPVLDPGNDNINTLFLLLSDKGLVTFKPEKPSPHDWTYHTHTVPFEDKELINTAVNTHPHFTDKKHKDSYESERCQSIETGRDAFSKQVQASNLRTDEKQRLIKQRKAIYSLCSESTNLADNTTAVPLEKPNWSSEGVLYAVYIKGVSNFYNNRYDEAKRYFDILTDKSVPWLAETASYMLIRTAIGKAYDSGKDDMDFVTIDNINQDYVSELKEAINNYLTGYPEGLYARSARGFLRRAHWFAGDPKALSHEINWQLTHLDSPQYNLDATNLPAEIVRRMFGSKYFDEKHLTNPMLIATRDLMRMRKPIYSEEKGVKTLVSDPQITLAELQAQQPFFKNNMPLYQYLIASYYYYVAFDPEKALAYLPSQPEQLNALNNQSKALSYTDFSRYVLTARVYDALNQPIKSRDVWQQLARLPHQPYQSELAQLALSINHTTNHDTQELFQKNSLVTDTELRKTVMSSKADDDTLHYIINAKHITDTEKQYAIYYLLKNNLQHKKYGALSDNLALLKKSYVSVVKPDPDSDEPQTTPDFSVFVTSLAPLNQVTKRPCGSLKQVASQLHHKKHLRKNKTCLAYFLQESNILYDDYYWYTDFAEQPVDSTYIDSTILKKDTNNLINPHELYQDILRSKRKDSLRGFALYKLVNCYKSSGTNHCGGKSVSKSVRQSWFKQLKRDYAHTNWAKQQKYYW